MTDLIIRNASINDIDEILEIESESFIDPWKKENLESEFQTNPFARILVASLNNKVIGFIIYYITFNSSTIAQIAVKKEYRKQGVGEALMNEMINVIISSNKLLKDEKEIEENFIETMTLEVRESNTKAINLYKKLGFKELRKKPGYYKDGETALYLGRWF